MASTSFADSPLPKPAFTINLFRDGFALDNQETQLYWRSAVGEEMIVALDGGSLTPLLENLLSEVNPEYSNGAVLVEVRDFRLDRDSDPPPYLGLPRITTMKLRPTYATLTADLESSPAFEYLTEEDLLKAEARLINAMNTICIDPSPQVLEVASSANYNRNKFNVDPSKSTSTSIKMRIVPQRKRSRTVADESDEGTSGSKRPKLGIVPFLNRIGMPMHSPLEDGAFIRQITTATMKLMPSDPAHPPRDTANRALLKIDAVPPADIEVPLNAAQLLAKRPTSKFKGKGNESIFLEVIPKPNGSFDGRLRVGVSMEPGTAGEYSERFSIGNADSANALIQTMKDLEAFDSQYEAKLRQNAQMAGQQGGQGYPPGGQRPPVGRGGPGPQAGAPGGPQMQGHPGGPHPGGMPHGGMQPGMAPGQQPGVRRIPGQGPPPGQPAPHPGMAPQRAPPGVAGKGLAGPGGMPPVARAAPISLGPARGLGGKGPSGPGSRGPGGKSPSGPVPTYPGGNPQMQRPGPPGVPGHSPSHGMPPGGMPPGGLQGAAGKRPGALPPNRPPGPPQGMAPPPAGIPSAGVNRGGDPSPANRKSARQPKKRKRDDDDDDYS